MQLTVSINHKLICDSAVSPARTMRITFSKTGEHIQNIRSIASTQNNWYLAVIALLLCFILIWHYSHGFPNYFISLCIFQGSFSFDIHSSQIAVIHSKDFFKSRKVFLRLSISEYQKMRLIETSDQLPSEAASYSPLYRCESLNKADNVRTT